MNDRSELTRPTQQMHMRRDLFLHAGAELALKDLVHSLEKCDRCGSTIPLYQTTFTGQEFLCFECSREQE